MADRKRTKESADERAARGHEDTVRKGYEAAQEPERQGDGDPGPDRVSGQPAPQRDGVH